MKAIFVIFAILCLVNCDANPKNTEDPEFEQLFQVKHIQSGDGENFPKPGNQVTVHYTGTLLNGSKFDSSKDRGQPFSFTLKRGQVIKCWDEVVSRMSRNEIIQVVCPSGMAYGDRGVGSIIPANSDLVFEIEMIDWKDNGKQDL